VRGAAPAGGPVRRLAKPRASGRPDRAWHEARRGADLPAVIAWSQPRWGPSRPFAFASTRGLRARGSAVGVMQPPGRHKLRAAGCHDAL